jgi:hypothetical protein
MTTVTVFRHAPPPVIGVCGVVFDRGFEAFEQTLDWLEAIGTLVERFDPDEQPEEAARFQAVTESLAREGDRCLPLILVDGVIVSSAGLPTRSQLARVVGRSRRQTPLPVAR